MSGSSHTYPVVQFLVAQGHKLSWGLSLMVWLLFAVLGWQLAAYWLLPVGAVVSALMLGLLLSYIEVLRIIADTLIPKY